MYMFLATNLQVTDGDIEVISYEIVFKIRLTETLYKSVLGFDLQITCSNFDLVP